MSSWTQICCKPSVALVMKDPAQGQGRRKVLKSRGGGQMNSNVPPPF